MKSLAKGDSQDAFERFVELAKNPLLTCYQIEDFAIFDWEKAKKEFDLNKFSMLKQYFFAVHKNLARLLKDPIDFYMQVSGIKIWQLGFLVCNVCDAPRCVMTPRWLQ